MQKRKSNLWPKALLVGWFAGLAANAILAADLTLAGKGAKPYKIILPANSLPSERYAAEELQRYLEKISGAKLPIGTDADPVTSPEILLGDNLHLGKQREKIDFPKLGPDGFVLRT